MTRGEAGKHLNAIMVAIDALQATFRNANFRGSPRVHERINTIRDQVVLLALDLRLPIQPVEEKVDGDTDRHPGETG